MLEITALLQRRSKHSNKVQLHKPLTKRWKQQGWWSPSMNWTQWYLYPCMPLSGCCFGDVSVGNKNGFTLCIPSEVFWWFQCPACADSHSHYNYPSYHLMNPLLKGEAAALQWVPSSITSLLCKGLLCGVQWGRNICWFQRLHFTWEGPGVWRYLATYHSN